MTPTDTRVTVSYQLSARGQKAAACLGLDAQAQQALVVSNCAETCTLINQPDTRPEADGTFSLRLRGWRITNSPVFDASDTDRRVRGNVGRAVLSIERCPEWYSGSTEYDAPLTTAADIVAAVAAIDAQHTELAQNLPQLQAASDVDFERRLAERRAVVRREDLKALDGLRTEVARIQAQIEKLEAVTAMQGGK